MASALPQMIIAEDEASASSSPSKKLRIQSSQAREEYEKRIRHDDILSTVKGQTKQSKRIPYWLWLIIAKSLGIKLHDHDNLYIAWTLHLLTIASAAGMLFTRMWFSGYDIASVHTESDILDGSVSVVMILLYAGLGVYAHRLAFRLFFHPKLLEMMRLHSKTILKLNTAMVVLLILAAFALVQSSASIQFIYGATKTATDQLHKSSGNSSSKSLVNPCSTVEIPIVICQTYFVSQLVFSFFFWIWNAMVAAVLICVARTHTISIRRFISELEIDAHILDKKFRDHFYVKGSADAEDTLKSYLWQDTDNLALELDWPVESVRNWVEFDQQPTEAPLPESGDQCLSDPTYHGNCKGPDDLEESHPELFSEVRLKFKEEESPGVRQRVMGSRVRHSSIVGHFRRLSEEECDLSGSCTELKTAEPRTLCPEEILHKHWKLSMSTRFTSLALQRWMCTATITIILWLMLQIISWMSHTPDLCGVLTFILPLLLLPLVASAYAEVNYEGRQALQSILPTPDRTGMFRYLYGMPIQMSVYGHPVTYGSMGTVLAAVTAAFMSKILLQEMNKLIDG